MNKKPTKKTAKKASKKATKKAVKKTTKKVVKKVATKKTAKKMTTRTRKVVKKASKKRASKKTVRAVTAKKSTPHKTIAMVHGQHQCHTPELRRRVKKLTSALVMLTGLAVGSLFVDVSQFFTERGLSAKAQENARVVYYNDATWVKYEEPKVEARVFISAIHGEDIATRLDNVVSTLAFFMPTIEFRRVDTETDAGRDVAREAQIAYAPAIHFSGELSKTAYYAHASELFTLREDGTYVLDMKSVDIQIAEYLEKPQTKTGVIVGAEKYEHELVVFGNLSCEGCDTTFRVVETLQEEYPDKLKVVYKNIPEEGDVASEAGIYIGQCAYEQGLYGPVANILYARSEWKSVKPLARKKVLENYMSSVAELDQERFFACLDERTYDDQRVMDFNEANRMSITELPTLFLNDQLVRVTPDKLLKDQIESILAPAEILQSTDQDQSAQ